jgi:hypothetical protein
MSLKTHRVFCSAAFISDRRDSASISDTFLIPNRSPHVAGTFQFFFSETPQHQQQWQSRRYFSAASS